jgi:LmbE family N-acetylglucosaminyl deacetylase
MQYPGLGWNNPQRAPFPPDPQPLGTVEMEARRADKGSLDTPSLDTQTPGTSESRWRAHLTNLPTWQPHSDILTIVAPQPDDETLGAGGLIYTCAELGHEIRVILVTDGEKARPDMPNLTCTRSKELRDAMSRLAPDGARISYLHLPDGGVAANELYLTHRLIELVSPRSTLVAPYERDGDADHDATSRACQAAAEALGIRCVRYPIWAWDPWASGACATRSGRGIALIRKSFPPKSSPAFRSTRKPSRRSGVRSNVMYHRPNRAQAGRSSPRTCSSTSSGRSRCSCFEGPQLATVGLRFLHDTL